ncbi:maleylpyruvate isomerase N-terminal domain-containing protein [Pseudonocardia sp. N23]|uniref:maleylpyruvate isomerase N-terminal domain-containing protein n=1 Tax=Pseudonocardia sp. N23 TaxID=1987376 RepID=UPI000BFE8C57|nr:maleylpyruvate isomerase N-terminal domain-containing protein [Pseudonocardia sp. N23]GAY08540.1 ribosomal-protein-alanine acetyltransferase [Pseudonocardia sp. N23]
MDADDVRQAAAASRAVLEHAAGRDWSLPAHAVDMPVAGVVAHVGGTLLGFAADLAAGGAALTALETRLDPGASPAELVGGVVAGSEVLAAVVEAAPPDVRGHHPFGSADASGFAAMGVLELLVHTDDAARGLGVVFEPDAHLAHRVLCRLFPSTPRGTRSWPTLRWATGRCALDADHPRLEEWRWHSAPPDGRP